MAPHSSTLAWKIPWTEEPGGLQSMGSLRVMISHKSLTTERLHFHFSLSCIGEGNGNPLQCSCLENPRDRGAWWAAVSGVAQSQTRLKRLSSSSSKVYNWGLPCSTTDKEPACQSKRHTRLGFNPWVRKNPWKRAWQPTPVLLPGESHGQRSLVSYSPWSCKEFDMIEAT